MSTYFGSEAPRPRGQRWRRKIADSITEAIEEVLK
jgi:hypothetical protein